MRRPGAYIETTGFKSPLPIDNGFTHGAAMQPVGFFLPVCRRNQACASAASGAPVTRQMRQSGRISAPIAW
jgi:hypothetical protein